MSKMSELNIAIMDLIDEGEISNAAVEALAAEYNISVEWLMEAIRDCIEDQYDDSMDGDAASALASAGFGTDEDYGYADEVY